MESRCDGRELNCIEWNLARSLRRVPTILATVALDRSAGEAERLALNKAHSRK